MQPTTRPNRRNRYLLALLICGLGAVSWGTAMISLAVFTDHQQVNNTFTTGSVKLNAGDIAALSITPSNLMPGDTASGSVVVQNDGTAQLRYSLTATSTNPDALNLRSVLVLTVKDQGTSCGAFDGTTLFSGTLGAATTIFGNPAQGFQGGERNLNGGGANETLCMQVNLPLGTGPAFQGATTTVTFNFDAEQTANN